MEKRKLGEQGLEVSALGLGCMGMSSVYGHADDTESLKVLNRALELGINFWDTADAYGPYTNEELLGRALKDTARKNVIIATKFGYKWGRRDEPLGLDSSPAHVRKSVEDSLRRLDTDYIDLCYQQRLDPMTPIEDTVVTMAELVKEGKVRYIGLSEVGPGIIHQAHAIHPLSAVQSEYSLWERTVEENVIPALRELGIGFVAYSPLGRGFLAGKFDSPSDIPESDWRAGHPRFRPGNFEHNLQLVEIVKGIASRYGTTPAQVSLAWLLRQGKDIVPIPGTKHVQYLEENAHAADLNLPESAWYELDSALTSFHTEGSRYSEESMKTIDIAA